MIHNYISRIITSAKLSAVRNLVQNPLKAVIRQTTCLSMKAIFSTIEMAFDRGADTLVNARMKNNNRSIFNFLEIKE
jgi:hypothetical protein